MALLSACGGGGGSAGTPATPVGPTTGTGTTTYPLQAAFKALTAAGSTEDFTVSDGCTGTSRTVSSAAQSASFEGSNGVSVSTTSTPNGGDCPTVVRAQSGTTFYNADYAPLGSISSTGAYTVAVGTPLALPASVRVGDSQPVYTIYTTYTDSTRATRAGQVVEGFSIEADTAGSNSAIYHLTTQSFDVNNNLLGTLQSYYRIGTDGSMTLLSIDATYSLGFTQHFHYARNV